MDTPAKLRVLIVAAGRGVSSERLQHLAAGADLIIAADAGLVALRDLGLEPSAVVGDFDSLDSKLVESIPPGRLHHDPSQEDTDLEKALRFCREMGGGYAEIVGGTGGRLDHSINALSLALKYRSQVKVTLHDENGWATLAEQSPIAFEGCIGDKVSLIPAPAAFGLHSEGLRYPMQNLDLVLGGRDAVSNEFITPKAKLTWRAGLFLLYRQVRHS
jgi:thiamine pyrophosphokinase